MEWDGAWTEDREEWGGAWAEDCEKWGGVRTGNRVEWGGAWTEDRVEWVGRGLKLLLAPYDLPRNISLIKILFIKSKLGERTFAFAAPTIWNSLPAHLRTCTSITTFHALVKLISHALLKLISFLRS